MPGVVSQSRAIVASIAAILSLSLVGPASAGGPLTGLTDVVSKVTTGVDQTVDSVGTVVEGVTGARQQSSSGSQDQAAAPGQKPEPAAETTAAPQPAAPAPTVVSVATAVTRTVVAETVPALAVTTNRLAPAASDTAEPVVGAALGNLRAVTGSAVAATGAAVAEVGGAALSTVATVTEPVLPLTGTVLGQVDATISTTTTGLVGTVDELLAPPRSQGSNGPPAPQPGQGSRGVTGEPVAPGDAAGSPGPAKPRRTRKAAKPQAPAGQVPVAPSTQVSETPPIIHPGSPPRAGARDGGTAVPSLAPPTRTAAPSTGSSSAGGASGFAFVGFAVLAGLFALAAPVLSRRLKLWPALVRPLAFVSPPERPG